MKLVRMPPNLSIAGEGAFSMRRHARTALRMKLRVLYMLESQPGVGQREWLNMWMMLRVEKRTLTCSNTGPHNMGGGRN